MQVQVRKRHKAHNLTHAPPSKTRKEEQQEQQEQQEQREQREAGWLRRLAKDFPSFLPTRLDGTSYEGYLHVYIRGSATRKPGGSMGSGRLTTSTTMTSTTPTGTPRHRHSYWVSVSCLPSLGSLGQKQKPKTLKGAKLQCCRELKRLLFEDEGNRGSSYGELVQRRLGESANLYSFLTELQGIVERAVYVRRDTQLPLPLEVFLPLVEEVATCCCHLDRSGSRDNLVILAEDLSSMEYTSRDCLSREHVMSIRISPDYPLVPPKVFTRLPIDFFATPEVFHHQGEGGSARGLLQHMFAQFDKVVQEDLEPFWRAMDAIDKRAWVLEPDPLRPDLSCTHRRILLEKHVSMLVTVSPLDARVAPQISFLGAKSFLVDLEERASRYIFDETRDIVDNLEGMVGKKLPTRNASCSAETKNEEHRAGMCGICYSYEISTASNKKSIPEVSCENKKCGYLFHVECLVEWLQSDQSSRQTFNTLFGSCPYCSDPIICKTASL